MLKFDDFAKLEIKIGTITEAERVPNTDKLLKIIVDVGGEKRQVIGGFGIKYSPEMLIGKQAAIVLNIEPAVIRGVESNGIFLAIDAGEPVLLLPEKPVPNGSKVK
ncbi:MAG: hypothetical protein Q7S14_00725 [bacterium]|nr:hypothetical protein [bacterium]